MKNIKKGFTLIELLAVIIILAIIALIATPIVLNVVENSRKESNKNSVYGILDATKLYYMESLLDDNKYSNVNGKTNLINELNFSGKKPNSGVVYVGNTGLSAIAVVYDDICYKKEYYESDISETDVSNCNISEIKLFYRESILNGADPVLTNNLVPVIIDSEGVVRKADVEKEWYNYGNKNWANAVVLKNVTNYEAGSIIPDNNIESYFVWIPKYSYKLWNLEEYQGGSSIDTSKVHSIDIKFGLISSNDSNDNECSTPINNNQAISKSIGNCQVGDYMTHPAFLTFNTNGIWVGKFETGYEGAENSSGASKNEVNVNKITIKPNQYSWRSITAGNAFKNSYDYLRDEDSHMMKNTEWGAVAYLSHSIYGINGAIRKNNNNGFVTGYSEISLDSGVSDSATLGEDGTNTKMYNTPSGYLASTTGNITGIYDMSGGTSEYTMAFMQNNNALGGDSGIASLYSDFFTDSKWNKYYDMYLISSDSSYDNRILGDSTGEVGPFNWYQSSWYDDFAYFIDISYQMFHRGGAYSHTTNGIFGFYSHSGSGAFDITYRIVLAPSN